MNRDRYEDVLPPPGWEPKSAFFKHYWDKARAKFSLRNTRTDYFECPYCHSEIVMTITMTDKPTLD